MLSHTVVGSGLVVVKAMTYARVITHGCGIWLGGGDGDDVLISNELRMCCTPTLQFSNPFCGCVIGRAYFIIEQVLFNQY